MAEIEIRPLRREDDRSDFSCGEPALDRYFASYAGQNPFRLGLVVTWVAVDRDRVVGFATVKGGSLERRSLPDAAQRRRLPDYPLPVLRLARLGVDRRAQGHGIGTALVRRALHLALVQRDQVGCVGVVTDAKPAAVAFYESLGFSRLDGVREGLLHSEPTPMFLGIATIAAAVGRSA